MEFDLLNRATSEIAVELGLSIWMRRAGADLVSLRASLLELRGALVEVGGLDPTTEPVPFCGVSDRADVLILASYVCGLVRRASTSTGSTPGAICERVIDRLSVGHVDSGSLRVVSNLFVR